MKLNKTEARINKNGKLTVGSDDKRMLTIINPIKGTIDENLLGVIKNILDINNTYIFRLVINGKHWYCTSIAPNKSTDTNKDGNLYMYDDLQYADDYLEPISNICINELFFGKDISITGAIRKGLV